MEQQTRDYNIKMKKLSRAINQRKRIEKKYANYYLDYDLDIKTDRNRGLSIKEFFDICNLNNFKIPNNILKEAEIDKKEYQKHSKVIHQYHPREKYIRRIEKNQKIIDPRYEFEKDELLDYLLDNKNNLQLKFNNINLYNELICDLKTYAFYNQFLHYNIQQNI